MIFNIGGEENYRIQMAAPAPVFKNKGNIAEVINYRGITVLPVINKIIETIIKKPDKP